jgi:hypothetical protein
MITIDKNLSENKVRLTLQELSDLNEPLNYTMVATSIETNEEVTIELTDLSDYPERYNVFDLDASLFEANEYIYIVNQENYGEVEKGKLLVINSEDTDIYYD